MFGWVEDNFSVQHCDKLRRFALLNLLKSFVEVCGNTGFIHTEIGPLLMHFHIKLNDLLKQLFLAD